MIHLQGVNTSEESLRKLAATWGSVCAAKLNDGMQGAWCSVYGIILLDDRLTDTQRRCVLAHEISHARHGDSGCTADRWVERRANMEASAMLINPVEYAFAEQLYEGNALMMAQELNVMPWVVGAYRERLHDDPTLIMQ